MSACVDVIQAGAWVLGAGIAAVVVAQAVGETVGRCWAQAFVSQYSGRKDQ